MSGSDRQLYLSATVLDQAFLDATAQDNLDTRLELSLDIETSTGFIRASDRNKYVGSTFYQARLVFPTINRKISHWLQNQVEFSSLSLELSNVDQAFNPFEAGGADYTGFIGKTVVVKVGIRDVASTYQSVFTGVVTEIGGTGRTVKSLLLTARDKFDVANQNLPLTILTQEVYPNIEGNLIGTSVPVVYGDWTTAVKKATIPPTETTALQYLDTADIPLYCVNGLNALINTAINAQFVISENANVSLDTTEVWLYRGNQFTKFDPGDITNVNGSKNYLEIIQLGATLILPPPGTTGDGTSWQYESGDNIYVRVVGKAMPGGLHTNVIRQAQDILMTYGGFSSGDFDSSWDHFAAKTSPAQSAVANIPARAWVQDVQPAMEYVVSLLAQVRLEVFINRNEQIEVSSNHFDEFVASPSFTVKNWDVVRDTFKPAIDNQNNFNRATANYNKSPVTGETTFATGFYNNGAAIAQVGGKQITKLITFPNLYTESDVINQLTEILRLASAQSELIAVTLTSRSFLLELGDWVKVAVQIGSTIFDNVPAQVREIGYDPQGLKIPAVLWSMQVVPFPGWTPSYAGIVGGYAATITAE